MIRETAKSREEKLSYSISKERFPLSLSLQRKTCARHGDLSGSTNSARDVRLSTPSSHSRSSSPIDFGILAGWDSVQYRPLIPSLDVVVGRGSKKFKNGGMLNPSVLDGAPYPPYIADLPFTEYPLVRILRSFNLYMYIADLYQSSF